MLIFLPEVSTQLSLVAMRLVKGSCWWRVKELCGFKSGSPLQYVSTLPTYLGTHKSSASGGMYLFFSIWVFFHKHSQFTGEQGKGEAISSTSLYQFQLLDRHTLNRQLQQRAHLCTSAHSLLPDPHQETLFSKRKSLIVYSLLMCHSNLWMEAPGFISPPWNVWWL